VAFRQKVTAQAVGNLAGINPIIFFLSSGNGAQHDGMRYFHRGCMRLQMIIDPAGEDRGFHRHRPGLWQGFHPIIQLAACGINRALPVHATAHVLDTIADRFLVNI
jgi:hypothetical protein